MILFKIKQKSLTKKHSIKIKVDLNEMDSTNTIINSNDNTNTKPGDNNTETATHNNRENWWIALRIMLRAARIILKLQKRTFIKHPCMRKKRGRSDKNTQCNTYLTHVFSHLILHVSITILIRNRTEESVLVSHKFLYLTIMVPMLSP